MCSLQWKCLLHCRQYTTTQWSAVDCSPQVQRVGLDTDEEDYDGEESRKGERELVKGRAHQKWLVHITLESGHGLAVRDRTG